MESLPGANAKLRRFKRELVASLFLRRGAFWGYVQRSRSEAGIDPIVQTPEPVDTHAHYPSSWEQMGEVEQCLLRSAWLKLTFALRDEVIPEVYRLLSSPVDWTTFMSACLLYDPPETELLAFARIGDDGLMTPDVEEYVGDLNLERSSDAPVLPIKMLADPVRARDDAHWYREAVIDEIGKRFLEPQGLRTWEVFQSVIGIRRDGEGTLSSLGHEYAQRQLDNEPRPHIVVTEETTEEDVKKAFRAINASQRLRGQGGRPPRDQLVAIQCAVLYDGRRRSIDAEDKRRRNWTYESLAKEFGLQSANAAENYVNFGRKVMADQDTP